MKTGPTSDRDCKPHSGAFPPGALVSPGSLCPCELHLGGMWPVPGRSLLIEAAGPGGGRAGGVMAMTVLVRPLSCDKGSFTVVPGGLRVGSARGQRSRPGLAPDLRCGLAEAVTGPGLVRSACSRTLSASSPCETGASSRSGCPSSCLCCCSTTVGPSAWPLHAESWRASRG